MTTTPLVQRVLSKAEQIALKSGDAQIATRHLLLAIVLDGTSDPAAYLRKKGIWPEDVLAEFSAEQIDWQI
jgi:ATP-dependent Clp protease ATP-binding subunit ClpA